MKIVLVIVFFIYGFCTGQEMSSTMSVQGPIENLVLEIDSNQEEVINIPVYVHLLYKTNKQNINDSLIIQSITTLNEDFLNLNADIINVPDEFKGYIGNPKLNFYLAQELPNGRETNGIFRVKTKTRKFSFRKRNVFKESKIIDPKKCLNIYICNFNRNGSTPTGLTLKKGGYDNGVVVNYTRIGGEKRTLTHEVGHWLSLLHIFQGGCGNKDGVDDTPAQKKNGRCYPKKKIQCGNSIMYMNFMSYSKCRVFFTKGQVQKMHDYITQFKKL